MKRILFATSVLALALTTAFAIANTGEAKNFNSAQEASAQSQQRQSDVRDLTTRLANMNSRYQLGSKADRGYLRAELIALAERRRDMLGSLIESDPAEILRVALPEGFGASLPSEIRQNIEQHVDLEGKLEVLYACGDTGSHLSHFLKVADKRFSLHFADSAPEGLLTDALVRVKGVQVGEAIVLDSNTLDSSTSPTNTAAAVAPGTFGEQKVLVLLVNFQDNKTQPWTTDQVRSLVFGTVNNFYQESSYQQTWLSGDVFGWYTLPMSGATCDTLAIGSYATQAATAAGVNLTAYSRLVFAYPTLSACGFTGASTVGGTPSQSWINGSMALRTIGHELEHGFGLYHARAMDCGADVIGSTCSTIEYGDAIEILGQAGLTGHSHAAQKERLGWLNYGTSPSIRTVQSSGTYSLDPYESPGSNDKALKVLKSINSITGAQTWYYVEFRRPIGFDSFISGNSNLMNGVVVHTSVDPYGRDNYLLDMTPATASWADAALTVGRSYNDPALNLTITPVSVSNSGATVSVSFGPQQCVQTNPTMTLSSSASQWASAGSTVTYQLSVTNNNSGCSSSNFNLQASVPSAWGAGFDNPTVSIPAGGSVTVNLNVTSPSSAPDGFYNVGVAVMNSAATNYSASGSVTCSIMSGLTLSVASDQASYTRSQTASVNAIVSAGGSPVSGASVTFIMTKANGTKVNGTATTGANGSAIFKYRFNKQKDPIGTYQVVAGANLNGVVGSATTSFSVK